MVALAVLTQSSQPWVERRVSTLTVAVRAIAMKELTVSTPSEPFVKKSL